MSKGMILGISFCLSMLIGYAQADAVADSTNAWGYSYAALLADLNIWRKSPYVKVDSIGASVKGRAIWMVSITSPGDSLHQNGNASDRKHRIFIHARTHPAEVQANYISNEAIHFLIDSTAEAAQIRAGFIFNIVPMYNPDGVEEGHSRLNANLIDLEVNWDKPVLEPEVTALKRVFEAFMSGPIPIEVALNMHSDQFNCTRFFFYHYAAGTSEAYTILEKSFIEKVQGHFNGGIQNWDYVRSWDNGTQARYPEGFWWLNYKEKVLALTYEDTNCPNASHFDSTAHALVLGAVDFIRRTPITSVKAWARLEKPFQLNGDGIFFQNQMGDRPTLWVVSDVLGHRIAEGKLKPGKNFLSWHDLGNAKSGVLSLLQGSSHSQSIYLPSATE